MPILRRACPSSSYRRPNPGDQIHIDLVLTKGYSSTSETRNLLHSNVFSWISAIRSACKNGRFKDALCMYVRLQRFHFTPNTFATSAILKACARIPAKAFGVSVHAQIHKFGLGYVVYVDTALVDLYSKFGDIGLARHLFDEMPRRNVVSWNSIISGYLRAGQLLAAQKMFTEMPEKDTISWNSMISGYAKSGDMGSAEALFWEMPHKNVASWNAMVGGFIMGGNIVAARKMFDEMPERSVVSWIEMISGYAKCGAVDSAREVFDMMAEKDLAAWNAIIACYAQNSRPKEAIHLFKEMHMHDPDVQPDGMTFASVISACSQLGDLRYGSWIESYMPRIGIELDDHLITALVDFYAKCGSMDKACELFDVLKSPDLIAYSAMIMGCGINGRTSDAICLFERMVGAKIRPNDITLTGLLTAYNHAGMVEEGWRCFASLMTRYQVPPSSDHYAIMVDLLGRAGRLEEALGLIQRMPIKPHVGVWGALLLACKLHCNVELGELAAQQCIQLGSESECSGYLILLANTYASAARWNDAKRLRKVVEENRLAKVPGCSWMSPG